MASKIDRLLELLNYAESAAKEPELTVAEAIHGPHREREIRALAREVAEAVRECQAAEEEHDNLLLGGDPDDVAEASSERLAAAREALYALGDAPATGSGEEK